MTVNPFDAADLTILDEAQHVFSWYTMLSESMRQQVINTLQNTDAALAFVEMAFIHVDHDPDVFDAGALWDFEKRLRIRLGLRIN